MIDVFLDLQIPYDAILPVLERMLYNDEAPFQGRNRNYIAHEIVYVCVRWHRDSTRAGGDRPFGRQDTLEAVNELLGVLMDVHMDAKKREECVTLRSRLAPFVTR